MLLLLFQFGCVYGVPPYGNADPHISRLLPDGEKIEKIRARVGVYVSDEVRNYVHRSGGAQGQVSGVEIGRHVVPMAGGMASALFAEAMEVRSLPPYMGQYRPAVDLVMEPEILRAGSAVEASLNGRIGAWVKLRVKAYGLQGEVLWERDASGESLSEPMNLIPTMWGRSDMLDRAGRLAVLSAARRLGMDIGTNRPPEISSLLDARGARSASGKRSSKSNLSDANRSAYQKGVQHLQAKDYERAFHSFQQAADSKAGEHLLARFYQGVCCVYTGRRSQGLDIFKAVSSSAGRDEKLAGDCNKWIQRLGDPLQIAIVFPGGAPNSVDTSINRILEQGLSDTGMYSVVRTGLPAGPAGPGENPVKRNRVLEELARNGVEVALFIQVERSSKTPGESEAADALPVAWAKEGDAASEFNLTTRVRVFGTNTKRLVGEFALSDSATRPVRLSTAVEDANHLLLAGRNSNRLALKLLENDIF